MRNSGSGLRQGLVCCIAGLGPVATLFPLTLGLAGGGAPPHRLALTVLLLETVYIGCGALAVGVMRLPARNSLAALAVVAAGAAIAVVAALASGAGDVTLLRAQPQAAAIAVLGWGVGRAARGVCVGAVPSAAAAFLIALAFATSLLPVSHVSTLLGSSPAATELLLATNPFVGVASSAGYDLVRHEPLYTALTLADHRFRYPRPLLSATLLAGLGVVFGLCRTRLLGRLTRRGGTGL